MTTSAELPPDTCAVCYCPLESGEEIVSPSCKHGMHVECAVGFLRSAIGDAAAQVKPRGVRCTCFPQNLGGCQQFLDPYVSEHVCASARASTEARTSNAVPAFPAI